METIKNVVAIVVTLAVAASFGVIMAIALIK